MLLFAMIHDLDLEKRMLVTVEDQVDISLVNAIQMSVDKYSQIDYPELIAARAESHLTSCLSVKYEIQKYLLKHSKQLSPALLSQP